MSKVITKLYGGVGNQMFQYAAGRALSLKLGFPLFLDTSWYINRNDRKLLIDQFCLSGSETFLSDKKTYFLNTISGQFSSRIISITENVRLLKEKKLSFNHEYDEVTSSVYLDGYWQTEKYFSKYKENIRQDFFLRHPPPKKFEIVKHEIITTESVCVHVRRGDYISNKIASEIHGICPISYYENSIDYFLNNFKSPKFFIFSDDPAWVIQNMTLFPNTRIMDVNQPDEAYLDLSLMSNCKHFVIANSTFSWWAAWLSDFKNKTIISPKKWFKDDTINNKDLIPNSWLQN